jgi:hypothetical protein
MAAEIRVDTITSRSGINTLSFTGDGFSFLTSVGIGTTITTNPVGASNTSKLAVGIVTANYYYGDGSNLTGITAGATLSAASGSQRLVVTSLTSGTMTSAATDGDLTYDASTDTLNASKANFTSSVTIGTGSTIYFADNAKAIFGDGEDAKLYHDGSNTYLQSLTGSTVVNVDTLRINNSANTENIIEADANGAVKLYYDNSKKLETISIGVTVSGSLVSAAGTLGSNGNGTRTVSVSSPTGGVDGDIWYQY